MFRRKATPVETPNQSVNLEPDLFRSLPEVFSSRSVDMLMGSVLNHALQIAPQATRAYAVMRTGADRVVAVKGYGIELIGLELTGSWKNGMPKISTNLSSDLFGPNTPEVRAKLDAQGMREVRQSLIAPIRDRNQMFGALVLDAYGSSAFEPSQLESVTRWASLIGPQLSLVSSFNAYQQLAWGLTRSFVEAVESRDFNGLGHAQRVTSYAVAMGRELGFSVSELQDVWFAAMLHDLGKLSQEGIAEMAPGEHAVLGYNMLADLPALETARVAVRHHHEHWNGSGAPGGLAGETIPLYARIIAVANAFDHLTSERGEHLSTKQCLARLREQADQKFDARLVEVLEKVIAVGRSTAELRPDEVFPL